MFGGGGLGEKFCVSLVSYRYKWVSGVSWVTGGREEGSIVTGVMWGWGLDFWGGTQ